VLGVERLSIDDVQHIEWKLLNDKMKKWVHEGQDGRAHAAGW
jgi:exocyst complex component 7